MSVIRWEEPPPHGNTGKKRVNSKYQETADTLRAEPGNWGVVAEGIPMGTAGSLSHHIRNGRNPWAPKGAFEVRCVGRPGETGTVYARYVGGA